LLYPNHCTELQLEGARLLSDITDRRSEHVRIKRIPGLQADDYRFVGDRRFNSGHVIESPERSFEAGCAQATRQSIHDDLHFMDLRRRVGWAEKPADDERPQGEEDSVHRFRASVRCSGYRQ